MIITTTNNIANLQIDQYLDIIFSNVVLGNDTLSEWMASITDIFGGRSDTYQGNLEQTYRILSIDLESKAKLLGANAIVGVRYDFEEITGKGVSMFMATATGTAVKVSRNRFVLYEKLHALKTYLNDGILNEEEYEYEKKRLEHEYNNPISEEIKAIQDNEARMKIEFEKAQKAAIARFEKEKQEEKDRLERIAEAERQRIEIAEKIKSNESLVRSVQVSDVLAADASSIDNSLSLGDAAKDAMCSGKIPEFCKYYMDTTGLDASDAIDYVQSLYDLMQK